ncbi:MAB_1171c family putative transporter [Streptomyces sp. NPDC046557]|uniref:MAB_1171c family putative transporter n=1 Tax=Streptomyces sp. NPDC046557 TaxID=3155372 RepID=UPI0033FA0453
MQRSDYYIPAFALAIALVVKLPSLWHSRRSPMSQAIFVIIVASGGGFVFAAPPTVERVNRVTGISNVSALIVYCFLSCLSCASMVLLLHWRGGPEATVRRHTRLWIAATACVISTFCVLFSLSDVPAERPRDLDTFYATTPFIGEMIVLYLTAHAATATVVMTKCWRWSAELRAAKAGWTRWGLLTLVTAFGLGLSFAVLKFVAVAARWAGTDAWDVLSTDIAPPLAGLGALMTTVGFLIPVVGPRLESMWDAWHAYRRMEPLWRALEPWVGTGAPMRIARTSSLEMRATLRATEIADRLLNLAPHLDARHRAAAERYATARGFEHEAALVVAEAATIKAALACAPVACPPDAERPPADDTEDASGPLLIRISGTNGLAELSRHFSRIHSTDLLVDAAHSESN